MEKIKTLRKLGLTEYEARAYLSLAKLGPSTVKEIVLESKLPRNKTYEALQKLEQKNKIMSLPISPKKFKITNPEIFKEEAESITNSVNELIKIIEQPRIQEFKEMFWVIKGQEAIREKMNQENKNAKKEILTCASISKPFYKNIRSMKDSIKKGIKFQLICNFDKNCIESYKEYQKTGIKIRIFNEEKFGPLLPRISIYDKTKARLTVGQPEVKKREDYITLWTESKAFAQMLRNHFLNMWKQCEPIEKYLK